MNLRIRGLAVALCAALLSALAGCAHNNPRDPLEPLNRGIYAFNDGVDTVVLKPLAQGYRAALPQVVRTGVGNFFSNLDDITVVVNDILQLKIPQFVSDVGRFVVNSTVGVLGLFDVATHFGLEKHNEDFGQTLGYWGIGSGPYLVLPILGPSSFRDALGRWADFYTDAVWQVDHMRTRNQLTGTRTISNRSRVLDTEKVLETAAIDEYNFIRDAYLQRRRNLVYDGNPPPEPEDEELDTKPRSEAAPPGVTTVVLDRFGNVVAGGEAVTGGIVPTLEAATSRPPTAAALPTAGPTRAGKEPPPAEAPNLREGSGTIEAPVGGGPQVVRVWLAPPPGQ